MIIKVLQYGKSLICSFSCYPSTIGGDLPVRSVLFYLFWSFPDCSFTKIVKSGKNEKGGESLDLKTGISVISKIQIMEKIKHQI